MDPPEGGFEVGEEGVECCAENLMARDDHIVMSQLCCHRRDLSHRLAQTPAHPVTLYRASGLFGDGEADPWGGIGCVRAETGLQGEQGCRSAAPFGGREKIAALEKSAESRLKRGFGQKAQAESFLRPCLRRLARTLRPPTVAMRERKPWRRLRTSLLG